ncbi:P-II family nitrogen regulator [Mucisphaera sp.]|uniref:P-II family nitrogen regulator n=1 Tax=Mucisphaera sp. TaxID=2913024 RepID=UPI003D0A9D9E
MMKNNQRIEIVVGSTHLQQLIRKIEKAGATGWTLIHNVSGLGGRGPQAADELSGASSNAYLLVAVPDDLVEPITAAAQPILQEAGGLCLVSPCQRLIHHENEA